MTKLAWGDEDPRVRRVVQQVLDQLVLGKGLRRDKNGKIELAVGDRSPFYFEGSDLQLRAADGLVVSPGSPTALRVDTIEPSKVRQTGTNSTSVDTSLRRLTTALATANARIDALVSSPIRARGTATLVAGTVTVSTALVSTGDLIYLSNVGTGGTVGVLSSGNVVDATSFDVTSSSILDTSTVAWMVVSP